MNSNPCGRCGGETHAGVCDVCTAGGPDLRWLLEEIAFWERRASAEHAEVIRLKRELAQVGWRYD